MVSHTVNVTVLYSFNLSAFVLNTVHKEKCLIGLYLLIEILPYCG